MARRPLPASTSSASERRLVAVLELLRAPGEARDHDDRVLSLLKDLSDRAERRPSHRGVVLFTEGEITWAEPVVPGLGSVFFATLGLVHLLGELASLGVFARGLVIYGEVSATAGAVLGEGLAQARQALAALGPAPRVVLHPALLVAMESERALRASHHDLQTELGYLRGLLRQDADGLWFVDYLYAFRREMDDPLSWPELLEDHRAAVDARLQRAVTLDREGLAALWLRRYHREVLDEAARSGALPAARAEGLRRLDPGALIYQFPGVADPVAP